MGTAVEIKNLEDLKSAFLDVHKELKGHIETANGQMQETGKVSTETAATLKALSEKVTGIGDRLDKAEGKLNRSPEGAPERKSIAKQFVESPEFKALQTSPTLSRIARMEFKFDLKAITNSYPLTNDQALVPADRLGIPPIMAPNRRLTIRDLMPTGRTSSNLVQYAKENVFTNNAGPQVGGSPTTNAENVVKNESDITFTLADAPVVTLAHFILASRQILDDAPMLQSYIDNRLMYGLKLEEEDEILNGTGGAGELNGLRNQQTAYNRAVSGETRLDTIRRAITQLQLSEFNAEVLVVNPEDWEAIELQKDNENRYLIANPYDLMGPRIWALRVVVTNSMPEDQFLVANFSMATQLWDRMQAAVAVSTEDDQNFRKNMVTILAEERLALTVYRPAALIGGPFPAVHTP